MSSAQYASTPLRLVGAVLTPLLVAIFVAHSRVWAAIPALGLESWLGLLMDHLQVLFLDFAPSVVLAMLAWLVLSHIGARDAKYAVLVGALSFYLGPRLYALLYLLQWPYWTVDDSLLVPRISEMAVGATLCLLMWAVAYWKPSVNALKATGTN